MKFNIGTVVVDFDNTIMPTKDLEINSLREVPRYLGLRVPSIEECEKIWPLSRAEILNILWPGQTSPSEFDQAEEELGLYDDWEVTAFPGAVEALLRLSKKYCLMLATNREKDSLEELLEKAGISTETFAFIQPVEEAEAPKPSPRFFDKIKEKAKDRIVYVGDSIHDLISTQGATDKEGRPILFVPVLTGTTTREEFLSAGVKEEFIAESLVDVPEVLTNMEAVVV